MKKIVIFGVGLIGGSVALALKKAQTKPGSMQIIGLGRNPASLASALQLGVIDAGLDSAQADLQTTLADADVILIAAPVAQTSGILARIKPHLNPHTVITDAGSTKSDVLACAQTILVEQFNQFVGGHPIAGAEKSGVTAARADLFVGKNVVLTPSANTQADALARVTEFWQACGAKVSSMSAQAHDEIFASVSHLPHLLAFALVDELAARPNAAELFGFAASGFRDFTRIAGSHPEMWRDISLANKDALLKELAAYQDELARLKTLLQNQDGAGLEALFSRASLARNAWPDGKL
ncbi:TyrA Prephenate dehydrogenase [Methylophilaceae bacterium]